MSNINFELPDELHKQFKIASILNGKDMRDNLIEFIEKYVKDANLKIKNTKKKN